MTQLSSGRPAADEYAPYFSQYLDLVTEDDILVALDQQLADLHALLDPIDNETAQTKHAPYTWTLKQVLGHLLDNETIFAYRALCFAAQDPTPLPGYEQDDYAAAAEYDHVDLQDLVTEFEHARRKFILFCRRLPAEAWLRDGVADRKRITVRAIAYLQVGHARHHLRIVKQRLEGAA